MKFARSLIKTHPTTYNTSINTNHSRNGIRCGGLITGGGCLPRTYSFMVVYCCAACFRLQANFLNYLSCFAMSLFAIDLFACWYYLF